MPKGVTNNPLGRPKGTKNKVLASLRELLADKMQTHIENLPNLIDEIETAKDKVDAISKILPYILPKLNTVTINDETKESVQPPDVTFTRKDMSNGGDGSQSETI